MSAFHYPKANIFKDLYVTNEHYFLAFALFRRLKLDLPDTAMQPAKTVSITYVDPDGEEKTVDAEIGQNLLNVAHENDVELEGKPSIGHEMFLLCLV